MKRLLLLLAITVFTVLKAASQQGLYLSVNPLGVLEPQAAYGMAIGYDFSEKFDLSTEYSVLTKPTWTDEGKYNNIKGFRSITAFKFTTSANEWKRTRNFVAAEMRIRNFSYDDIEDFTNVTTHSIIKDYQFKNKTRVFGVAALVGKQRDMTEDGRFVLEVTAGIGIRHTAITRLNTPDNAVVVPTETGFGEIPNYRNEQTSFYFPLAVRVIFKL